MAKIDHELLGDDRELTEVELAERAELLKTKAFLHPAVPEKGIEEHLIPFSTVNGCPPGVESWEGMTPVEQLEYLRAMPDMPAEAGAEAVPVVDLGIVATLAAQ